MIKLRGMTWNHPRGVLPLKAASAEFRLRHPTVELEWDARSLHDFEAFPLETLAESYDFIMIDHPHIGAAVRHNVLVPMDDWHPRSFLEEQSLNSVGPSYESYSWSGKQWAFAVDAAAQVSAYRHDLLQLYQLPLPRTWEEVRQLIRDLPRTVNIALPLAPVHAFASFVTLSAQLSGDAFWHDGEDLSPEIGASALAILKEMVPFLHESSFRSDPILMSDLMASSDEIAYIPLIYGYVNYSRSGFATHVLRYADIPADSDAPSGSMIGGVGIAVSNRCRHLQAAMEFVRLVSAREFQRTAYVTSGGQPGHRAAWTDTEANRMTHDFFSSTLRTLDLGYLRPRFDGYIAFQEQAGAMIREWLISGESGGVQLVCDLNKLLGQYQRNT